MSDVVLGGLLDGEHERDAVHVAISQVFVSENTKPGTHVGFTTEGDNKWVSKSSAKLIGVIDPYLKKTVKQGQSCWLFLYPNTVTSLKHFWTHPDFTELNQPDLSESEQFIEDLAGRLGFSYERLLDYARDWVYGEEYSYDNSERYKDIPYQEWEKFWEHFEKVTEMAVRDKKSCFFTCSC